MLRRLKHADMAYNEAPSDCLVAEQSIGNKSCWPVDRILCIRAPALASTLSALLVFAVHSSWWLHTRETSKLMEQMWWTLNSWLHIAMRSGGFHPRERKFWPQWACTFIFSNSCAKTVFHVAEDHSDHPHRRSDSDERSLGSSFSWSI